MRGKKLTSKGNIKRSSKSLWLIYAIFTIFKIIGLATFSLQITRRDKQNSNKVSIRLIPSRIGKIYNVILLSIIVYTTIMAVSFIGINPYPGKSLLLDSLNGVQTVVSCAFIFTVISSYCLKQESIIETANRLIELKTEFDKIDIPTKRMKIVYPFLTVFFLTFVFSSAHFFTFLLVIYPQSFGIIGLSFYNGINACVCLFMMQYFLVVLCIKSMFFQINQCLEYFSKIFSCKLPYNFRHIHFDSRIFTRSSIINHVVYAKIGHSRLCRLIGDVSNVFSLSSLVNVLYIFCYITSTVSYIIVILISGSLTDNILDLCGATIFIVSDAFPTAVLMFAVTKLTEEVAETARAVHGLLNYTTDREFKSELKLFSLQLLHEKPVFTACGFFTLDCTLLQAIVGAVATYMVILIQFQVSSTQQKPSCCSSNCTKS